MAGVAVAFGTAIPMGFVLRDRYPSIPDFAFGALVAGMLTAVAFGVTRLIAGPRLWAAPPPDAEREERLQQYRQESSRRSATYAEQRRQRVAELLADPAKFRYAALVERGEHWSDEQIAYQEDPMATATCRHLAPIERAMRSAGIVPKWMAPLRVTADCCVDETGLRNRMALAESVRYTEGYRPERDDHDNPWAGLSCSRCGSAIGLAHPEWPCALTRWFPAKPH
jgi:hypothetical protein